MTKVLISEREVYKARFESIFTNKQFKTFSDLPYWLNSDIGGGFHGWMKLACTFRKARIHGKKTSMLKHLEAIALNEGIKNKDLIKMPKYHPSYISAAVKFGLVARAGRFGLFLTEFGKEWFKRMGEEKTFEKIIHVYHFSEDHYCKYELK